MTWEIRDPKREIRSKFEIQSSNASCRFAAILLLTELRGLATVGRKSTRDRIARACSNTVMKNIVLAVLCSAMIFAAGCSTPDKSGKTETAEKADKPQQSDMAALQGSWKGRTIRDQPEHQCSFVITGKNFEFHDDTDTNLWYKGTFSLKEGTVPRQYIAMISDCPFPQYAGKTSMAIYKIEGDTLTITANEPGNPAVPEAFDAPDSACIEVKRK